MGEKTFEQAGTKIQGEHDRLITKMMIKVLFSSFIGTTFIDVAQENIIFDV